MDGGQVGGFAGDADDAGAVLGRGGGVEHGPALGLQLGDEERAFTQQFGGDVRHANFGDHVHRGLEAHDTKNVVRPGLEAARPGVVGELVLRGVVRAADVVPTERDGAQLVLHFLAHVEDAGGARREEPFVSVRGEEVHVLHGDGECAERLHRVHAEEDAARAQSLADGVEVNAPAGDEVRGSERDEPRVLVHLPEHVHGADAAQLAGVEVADFHALRGEGHPRVDVRGKVVVVDDDVVGAAEGEAAGDHAQRERGGADEGDFIRLRADEELGGGLAGGAVELGQPYLLVVLRGEEAVVPDGVGGAAGEGRDAGVGEVSLAAADGESVLAEALVREDFGNGHEPTLNDQ